MPYAFLCTDDGTLPRFFFGGGRPDFEPLGTDAGLEVL